MRVISGALKGRRLTAPFGTVTRPTADRIKESIFNILADRVREKRVLDLFAGSGALGIEALSRGAASAVFVDQAKAAVAAIQSNTRSMELEKRVRIIRWNILSNLNCLASAQYDFDLIFMDPPYEADAVAPAITALASCGALATGARVIIEHSVREPIVYPKELFILADQRRYGKTLVSFMDGVV